MTLTLEVELPADLALFRLPDAVAARLQDLLDRQDSGQPSAPATRPAGKLPGVGTGNSVKPLRRVRSSSASSRGRRNAVSGDGRSGVR